MKTENEKLTFGELKVGDKFIAFPRPGDNAGHGGYKVTHWIFQKVNVLKDNNAVRFNPPPTGVKNFTSLPDSMEVIKVE